MRANESSAPVPTSCLLFLVTNGSLTLVFHVGENRSHKMFAIFSYKW